MSRLIDTIKTDSGNNDILKICAFNLRVKRRIMEAIASVEKCNIDRIATRRK